MLTDEEIRAYARRGIRADVVDKGVGVKHAMRTMQDAFDKAPAGGGTATRFRAPVDGLMAALVAFSEALDKAEAAGKELS